VVRMWSESGRSEDPDLVNMVKSGIWELTKVPKRGKISDLGSKMGYFGHIWVYYVISLTWLTWECALYKHVIHRFVTDAHTTLNAQ